MKHRKAALLSLLIGATPLCHADNTFPIWGDEARASGADLPEPFGINMSYMHIRQGIDIKRISFDGLSMMGPAGQLIPIPSNFFQIEAGKTTENSDTQNFRFDTWVLPFLNVYAILGQTHGNSSSTVNVNIQGAKPPELQGIPFVLNFDGVTYGAGLTLAGAIDNWIGSLDVNYTRTELNVLDGGINSWIFTPRIGYQFNLPPVPGATEKSVLRVWTGGMYQNIQQTFRGDLSNLDMPPQLTGLVSFANASGSGQFDINQKLQNPWNWLVGMQYQPIRNVNIITELGFGGKRDSIFLSGEVRF